MAKLYLIPNAISENGHSAIPGYVTDIVNQLRYFVVEEEREGRRFVKGLVPTLPTPEIRFFTLNEHSSPDGLEMIFEEVGGNNIGVISDAGCPCVADPGSDLVLEAHRRGFQVVPLVGPSSAIMALMASGLNGQNFAFNGYLPKEREERIKKIKMLEKRSSAEYQSQIFMDTPYRNQHVFDDILTSCDPNTLLSVACDVTGKDEYIKTRKISEWKKSIPTLPKKPALFTIYKNL